MNIRVSGLLCVVGVVGVGCVVGVGWGAVWWGSCGGGVCGGGGGVWGWGEWWFDLCTNRFHFYGVAVIRDLSGNLTLLGRNYFV